VTPTQVQEEVVELAERLLAEVWPDAAAHPGSCLYRAAALTFSATAFGLRAQIQAGSAGWIWRSLPGGASDAFSYQWDPGSKITAAAIAAQRLGVAIPRLPEMHCWTAVGGNGTPFEVVDFSAGRFPEQLRAIRGDSWQAKRPPACMWAPLESVPDGCAGYVPNPVATGLALYILKRDRAWERLLEVAAQWQHEEATE
jgi:hypothetical protein